MKLSRDQVGYFSSHSQEEPVREPTSRECPLCGECIVVNVNVRTHSLCALEEGSAAYGLSVFYRTHASCADAAGEKTQRELDSAVVALFAG